MLLAIFGTPSPLTQWIVSFANTLVDVINGPPIYIPAMTIESLKEQWQNKGDRSVVFHSDTPRKEVIELFDRSGALIVVVSDPVMAVADFVSTARSLDIQTAARFTAQSVCTLAQFAKRSDTLIVNDKLASLSVSDFTERFLSFHKMEIDTVQRQNFLQRLVGSADGSRTIAECMADQKKLTAHAPLATRGIQKYEYISSVLGQYDRVIEGYFPSKFIWPREVFVRMDDLGYLNGPIELAGPGRVLIGGHALSLPRGKWRATASINVWDNISGNRVYSDIFAEDEVAAAVSFMLPASGRFRFSLAFECKDPYYPIIFRIALSEGAIEGWLDLENVSFEPLFDKQ